MNNTLVYINSFITSDFYCAKVTQTLDFSNMMLQVLADADHFCRTCTIIINPKHKYLI